MSDYTLNNSLLSNGTFDLSSSADAFEVLSPGANLSATESPTPYRNTKRCRIIRLSPVHTIFGCCECEESFLAPRILERHLRDAHPWLRSVAVCPECGQRFLHTGHVVRHRRERHQLERTHECDECGKRYKRAEHLRVHERATHARARDFTCTYCDKTFARKEHARRHEMLVHRPDLVLTCRYCDNKFSRTSGLTRHQKVCRARRSDGEQAQQVAAEIVVEPSTMVVVNYEEDDWINLLQLK